METVVNADVVNPVLEAYCQMHSSTETPLLKELVVETRENTTSAQMQVGHLEGQFLKMLVRLSKAKRILEIGTFTGYSSLAMSEALPEDGSLLTCDIDRVSTQIAQKYWNQSPHGKKITLKLGPALETLKSTHGPFDMVFIDADKANYWQYWELCLPQVKSGGLLVVDNVLWSGRVLKPREPSAHCMVEFNAKIARDSRVDLVMLTIRDGITLAIKK